MQIIFFSGFLSVSVALAFALLTHRLALQCFKKDHGLLILTCLGAGALFLGLEPWGWEIGGAEGPLLLVGQFSLYLAGVITYLESRALLSRGYSFRILIDLLQRGGSASLRELDANYGGGMGLEGLLKKRLSTISRLGLVEWNGQQVGPLTRPGRLLATLFVRIRNILHLEMVG